MRTALILGAGGAFGWVFHAGVIEAVAVSTGIDGRTADLIVGTSAGAAVGASLRAGFSPEDIAAAALRRPTVEEQAAVQAELAKTRRSFRPLAPRLARHAFPGGNGAALALAGLLPRGRFPASFVDRFPGLGEMSDWPDGLWIPAVRADRGEVVVFGRDRRDVAVREAVAASSAIPGLLRPSAIGGIEYVDGGLASPTHAHLAVAAQPDLVIISSPMTRRSRRPLARHAARRLAHERAVLEAAGIEVVCVEPTDALVELGAGFPRRNPQAASEIAARAAAETNRALAGAGLGRAPSSRRARWPAHLDPALETP